MAKSLSLVTFDESIYTKEELKSYTNEELIELIHETGANMYWEMLWIKTKNCVFKVYNTSVNSYNKDKNSEEIFSVLMSAWIHAVNTYDKNKATSEFYKYAIYIIKQKYIRYISRTNSEKEGKSVRYTYLEDYTYINNTSAGESSTCNIIDVIEDDASRYDIENANMKIDMSRNLEKLKNSMPDVYNYIVEYFFNDRTYVAIAEKYDVNTVTVRRAINKGLKQLGYYFNLQEKLSI